MFAQASAPLVNLSTMTDLVNHDKPLVLENLVKNAVIPDAELKEIGPLLSQHFRLQIL